MEHLTAFLLLMDFFKLRREITIKVTRRKLIQNHTLLYSSIDSKDLRRGKTAGNSARWPDLISSPQFLHQGALDKSQHCLLRNEVELLGSSSNAELALLSIQYQHVQTSNTLTWH